MNPLPPHFGTSTSHYKKIVRWSLVGLTVSGELIKLIKSQSQKMLQSAMQMMFKFSPAKLISLRKEYPRVILTRSGCRFSSQNETGDNLPPFGDQVPRGWERPLTASGQPRHQSHIGEGERGPFASDRAEGGERERERKAIKGWDHRENQYVEEAAINR